MTMDVVSQTLIKAQVDTLATSSNVYNMWTCRTDDPVDYLSNITDTDFWLFYPRGCFPLFAYIANNLYDVLEIHDSGSNDFSKTSKIVIANSKDKVKTRKECSIFSKKTDNFLPYLLFNLVIDKIPNGIPYSCPVTLFDKHVLVEDPSYPNGKLYPLNKISIKDLDGEVLLSIVIQLSALLISLNDLYGFKCGRKITSKDIKIKITDNKREFRFPVKNGETLVLSGKTEVFLFPFEDVTLVVNDFCCLRKNDNQEELLVSEISSLLGVTIPVTLKGLKDTLQKEKTSLTFHWENTRVSPIKERSLMGLFYMRSRHYNTLLQADKEFEEIKDDVYYIRDWQEMCFNPEDLYDPNEIDLKNIRPEKYGVFKYLISDILVSIKKGYDIQPTTEFQSFEESDEIVGSRYSEKIRRLISSYDKGDLLSKDKIKEVENNVPLLLDVNLIRKARDGLNNYLHYLSHLLIRFPKAATLPEEKGKESEWNRMNVKFLGIIKNVNKIYNLVLERSNHLMENVHRKSLKQGNVTNSFTELIKIIRSSPVDVL